MPHATCSLRQKIIADFMPERIIDFLAAIQVGKHQTASRLGTPRPDQYLSQTILKHTAIWQIEKSTKLRYQMGAPEK